MNDAASDVLKLINRWTANRCLRDRSVGCAVGIVEDGEIAAANVYGFSDLTNTAAISTQTHFQIASITKTFTALAIMQLIAKNKLRLDDPLAQHLEWFRSTTDERLQQITIRQLATHTAGLAREGGIRFPFYGYWPSAEESLAAVADSVVLEPNTRLMYSNFGYFLLGQLIQEITSLEHHEYLRQNVFEPLQMRNTICEPDAAAFEELPSGHYSDTNGSKVVAPVEHLNSFAAGGGAVSTIEDMCHYIQFYVNGNNSVLPDDIRHEMIRTHWLEPAGVTSWGIGLQHWTLDGRDIAGHSGLLTGFRSRFGFDTERKRGVVVLTNDVDTSSSMIVEATLHALEAAQTADFGRGANDRGQIDRYCGVFTQPGNSLAIAPVGSGLIGMRFGGDKVFNEPDILEMKNDNELLVVDGESFSHVGQTLLYEFEADGITPMHLHWGSYPAAYVERI